MDERTSAALAELRGLVTRVPKAYATWSWNTVNDFKRALAGANKVLSNSRATSMAIQGACSDLRRFHT